MLSQNPQKLLHADGVDQHAQGEHRQRRAPAGAEGDEVLHEHAHQGVGDRQPAVQVLGELEVALGVDRQQGPHHQRRDQAQGGDPGEDQEPPVAQDLAKAGPGRRPLRPVRRPGPGLPHEHQQEQGVGDHGHGGGAEGGVVGAGDDEAADGRPQGDPGVVEDPQGGIAGAAPARRQHVRHHGVRAHRVDGLGRRHDAHGQQEAQVGPGPAHEDPGQPVAQLGGEHHRLAAQPVGDGAAGDGYQQPRDGTEGDEGGHGGEVQAQDPADVDELERPDQAGAAGAHQDAAGDQPELPGECFVGASGGSRQGQGRFRD